MKIVKNNISLISCNELAQFPISKEKEIVFAGRSNAGKSSLINCIANESKLARVSSKPGKTLLINFFKIKNRVFVDLPGYGYAKVSKKQREHISELVEDFFSSNRKIFIVVLIVDCRRELDFDEIKFIEFLKNKSIEIMLVFSKIDKLNSGELLQFNEKCDQIKINLNLDKIFAVSCTKKTGIKQIKDVIFNLD